MIPRYVVPLALQGRRLTDLFPDSHAEIRRSRLTWIGELQPSPFSIRYTVGLEYQIPYRPKVQVVSPDLEARDGKRPEHLHADDCLCLYFYPSREWYRGMLLADTVLPWTAEWLLHYEIWLATGEWCGGGIHPGPK